MFERRLDVFLRLFVVGIALDSSVLENVQRNGYPGLLHVLPLHLVQHPRQQAVEAVAERLERFSGRCQCQYLFHIMLSFFD